MTSIIVKNMTMRKWVEKLLEGTKFPYEMNGPAENPPTIAGRKTSPNDGGDCKDGEPDQSVGNELLVEWPSQPRQCLPWP